VGFSILKNLGRYINNFVYILIALVYLLAIYQWLALNDFQTADVDDTIYLTRAYDFFNYAQKNLWDFLREIFIVQKHKPPLLIYLLSVFVWIFTSANAEWIILTYVIFINILFLINLNFFFRSLFPKKESSRNLTLILFAISPLMFGVSKLLLTELLLLNLILLFISLLHRWENSLSPYKSFFLGLITALGLLSKSTFIFYSFGVYLYLFREKGFSKNPNFKYFLLASMIALPWYSLNFFNVIGKFISAYNFERHSGGSLYLPSTYLNYGFDLIMSFGLFSSFIFLCFFLTRFQALSYYYQNPYLRSVFSAPILMFLAMFFVNNKNERFQYVSFFFLIVLCSLVTCPQFKNFLCKIFIAILIVFQAFLSYQLSFHKTLSWIPNNRVLYVTRPYEFFFQERFLSEIDPLLKMDLLDFRVADSIHERDIEVEFQERTRNPRSIIQHLKLLKAKSGNFGIVVDRLEDYKKDKYYNREYLLYINHLEEPLPDLLNCKGTKNQDLGYKYLRTLDKDTNMKIRFDLYENLSCFNVKS
jgi:hypothetical protein